MKKEALLVIIVLFSTFAAAECIEPTDGMIITKDVLFCSSTYDISNGISIGADNVVLDCGTAVLRGVVGESEIGIRAEDVTGITIKNCNVITFTQGLYLKNVTNSFVEDNAFLKNRIGIRLLDAYENTIRDNNDKSFQVAVSAINSKFNIVMLGNKEIERAFCEVNACNEFRDMNVCEAGDFYCSKKCSPQTDVDCVSPAIEVPKVSVKTVDEIVEEAKKEVQQEINDTAVPEKKTMPVWYFIYGLSAIVAIIAVIIFLRTKKR